MRIFLLFGILFFCVTYSIAQTNRENVESAVKDYVDAFYYGDSIKIHRSISEKVVKYGYYRGRDKTEYAGEPMSFREMIDYAASVGKRGPGPNVEKFPRQIQIFDVQDQTASARLTAWWGTDYILLAKINDHWMITHVLWQSPPVKS